MKTMNHNSARYKKGDVHPLDSGGSLLILKYSNHNDIDVITNTGYRATVTSGIIKGRRMLDKFTTTVLDIGFLGMGDFSTKTHREAYVQWRVLIIDKKAGRTDVCDEWLNFQNFATWFYERWQYGQVINCMLLDPEDKIYSPETSVFLPKWLNFLLHGRNKDPKTVRGSYCERTGKWMVALRVRDEIVMKKGFATSGIALMKYKEAKAEYILALLEDSDEMARIDKKAYDPMRRFAVSMLPRTPTILDTHCSPVV